MVLGGASGMDSMAVCSVSIAYCRVEHSSFFTLDFFFCWKMHLLCTSIQGVYLHVASVGANYF